MGELTIAARAVSALMELAARNGACRQSLIDRSRISAADLADADTRVPFSRYVTLMHAAQELCGDPAFALHYGEAFDVSELSLGCVVSGMSATTIDGVIPQMNHFAKLGVEVECDGNGERFQLRRTREHLWLIDMRRDPNAFPELTESSFTRMVTSTRRFIGDIPLFTAVQFTHAEPAYRAEYDRIFKVPLTFGSDRNAIGINERLMNTVRPPTSSPLVSAVIRQHAEALLERLETSHTTRGQVETLLALLFKNGDATVDVIAKKMAFSRQTLFRRLKEEGVTFEEVRDGLRRRMALRFLGDEKLSIHQAASRLGYSDSTAFSRAFKRWTGASPRTMRRPKPD